MNNKQIAQLASAFVALMIAILSSYLALTRQVEARPDRTEVRQMIEDKTSDKYAEIIRRQEHMDKQVDKLADAVGGLVRSQRRE